jgi:HTH-type transcriptional regulator/antitoxin HigA
MKAPVSPDKGLLSLMASQSIDEYLGLVRAFPLVHIGDDAQLASAIGIIDRLLGKPARSEAEEAYLGALTDIVETYEERHVTVPARSGLDALRFLMEENGLKQADLVPVLGRRSVVSEIMHHKRGLALSHVRKLAAYFHVSPSTFIDDITVPE